MPKLIVFFFCTILVLVNAHAQSPTYPEQVMNQSFVPPSPNAQGFQNYDNSPVALYTGLPSINIPIYTVKCGSLALPISLSYNSNGFFPLQDAGWVGLGWSLNAGGAISRMVEGNVDGIQNSGYNYGQYNLWDSIFTNPNIDSFLQRSYNNNLGYGNNSYDLAPDVFDAEFNGIGDKFFWISGKAYMLSYNKQLSISWPSPTSNITITTADGTVYTFSAKETTTAYYYGGPDSVSQSYTSAWFLTSIVSANNEDQIWLNYSPYTWHQAPTSYQTSYTLSIGTQPDIGNDPIKFLPGPSITTQVLTSIICRNSRISFIPDAAGRTDINGTLPRLREIDVIDSVTGTTVKKDYFSYKYFGLSTVNPQQYERLALKTFSAVNPQISSDSLTYLFKYVNESDTAIGSSGVGFPPKNTAGMDYWGYYNGAGGNSSILPPPNCIFYSPSPPSGAGFGAGVNRSPNTTYSEYGLLDTIVNPQGGYTAFQYQQNVFYSSALGGANNGPGVCLQSIAQYDGINPNPGLKKSYAYFQDNGTTSSGLLPNIPNYNGPAFVLVNSGTTGNYKMYKASSNSGGIGGVNPGFYYSKVTESITSGAETHKTDHYFTQYPELIPDIRETETIQYLQNVALNTFTPLTKTINSYTYSTDTSSILVVNPFIDTEYVSNLHSPKNWYAFSYAYTYWSTYWVYPVSQQTTLYDAGGDSLTTATNLFFNPTTRNLVCTEFKGSDGQIKVQKFKYPEDYTSAITGNMVSHRVLSPPIEQQTWIKQNSADSLLLSGMISEFDQTIFKLDTTYAVETTVPITSLSNETQSGGLYSTLISDAHYVRKGQLQYDGNFNLSVSAKASDVNISYLWDYHHSNPVAQVTNAAQADIAYTSFEADGTGNWSYSGSDTAETGVPTGTHCYNLGQSGGSISKPALTGSTYYIVSYWTTNSSALSIAGTQSGYPVKGKTINGWTYYEHKITGQSSLTISGTGYLDELRLYPLGGQMVTYTYTPLIGMSSQCDADNRVTYYQYDAFGRLKVVLDQDHNIIKTAQYHTNGETIE
ncbi:MAG TPA: hypothetical protein VFE32_14190 [Puia sp.]|jgi:YD repeat-containing protein|nr:hypothetical protein [Puia sp.]